MSDQIINIAKTTSPTVLRTEYLLPSSRSFRTMRKAYCWAELIIRIIKLVLTRTEEIGRARRARHGKWRTNGLFNLGFYLPSLTEPHEYRSMRPRPARFPARAAQGDFGEARPTTTGATGPAAEARHAEPGDGLATIRFRDKTGAFATSIVNRAATMSRVGFLRCHAMGIPKWTSIDGRFSGSLRRKTDEDESYRRCGLGSAWDARQRPTQPPTAANEGLQHASERYDRRRPEAVYEFLSERRFRRDQRAALHQRQALRQLLHRHGQGMSQITNGA
jgi:hypothetical protein